MDVCLGLVVAAAAYCVLDFITGMLFGRCVMPGLRCPACCSGYSCSDVRRLPR